MNNPLRTSRKGQSAIEYLMTYGWMLLVVAIVGGAVITTVNQQSSTCEGAIPSSLDATSEGFGVSQFGVTNSDVQIALKNNQQEEVNVTDVTLDGNDATDPADTTLSLDEEGTWTVSQLSSSESCTTATLNITYDQGSISGLTMSGEIEAKMG